jgi:CDP-diacylglycerol--glycerol-3-phosphate 3-phosphatidyltransferase
MIPQWITPNMITWIRFFLIPPVVYLNVHGWYAYGIPLFIGAAFTDLIDGSLARTRNQVTQFGKFFDPLVDKLLIGSLLIILVMHYINPIIGVMVLVGEGIFIVSAVVLKILGYTPQANRWGKIKMLLQCIAVCVILLGLTLHSTVLFVVASWIFGAAVVCAIISLIFHGI